MKVTRHKKHSVLGHGTLVSAGFFLFTICVVTCIVTAAVVYSICVLSIRSAPTETKLYTSYPKNYGDAKKRMLLQWRLAPNSHAARRRGGRGGTKKMCFVCHIFEPVSYTHLTLPTIYSV